MPVRQKCLLVERSSPPPLARWGLVLVAALALSATPALAQRGEAKAAFENRAVRIDYGAVRLGKHSLAELPPGGQWRLGSGNATKLETRTPLRVGSEIVPPGGYKLALRRGSGNEFFLEVARAGFALGQRGAAVLLPLRYEDEAEKKAAEKLAITCSPLSDPKAGDPQLLVEIRAAYGTHRVSAAAVLHGAAKAKAKGFDVEVFAIDADLVAERRRAGRPTPVATLSRKNPRKGEPELWNVVLGHDSVSLRPAPEAPKENYGFGKIPDEEIDPEEEALVREGTAAWAPGQNERKQLSLEKAETSEGGVVLVLGCGQETVTLDLPDPMRRTTETRRAE